MKRRNLVKTLFVSTFAILSLSGCDTQAVASSLLPSVESIQREGINIESITFENVPEEIKIGYFDTYEIYLKLVYSDGIIEEFPLTMASFPDEVRHVFNTVGEHTVTIAFRGSEVTYTFNVVAGKPYYLIRYFNYEGRLISQEKVIPGNKPTIEVPTDPKYTDRPNDALFKYTFVRWDKEVDKDKEAIEDIDIYPVYNKLQKRYDSSKTVVSTGEGHNFRLLHSGNGGYGHYFEAVLYLGRIDRVPLIHSTYVESTTPSISGDLYFDLGEHTAIEYTSALIAEIYSKAMVVDTSNYNSHFEPLNSGSDPVNPVFYNDSGFDINSKTNNNAYALFEGDTSYTDLYKNNLRTFVNEHDSNNKSHYEINASSDLTTGNPYYRAAIETSVDVIVDVHFNDLNGKYQIQDFTYYFLYNKNNTYPVAEYATTNEFGSTGNKISFNMTHLENVMNEVVEGFKS